MIPAEELWLLQTHLTALESRIVSERQAQLRESKVTTALDVVRLLLPPGERQVDLIRKLSCRKARPSFPLLTQESLVALLGEELPTEAPLALQFRGNPAVLARPRVGIVGSRHPTYYGRSVCARFVAALAEAGFAIVSGGAIGIDTIANATALTHGQSCAVIGNGLLAPYPSSNSGLFRAMSTQGNGLILSEFEEGLPAVRWNFPRRNLTIALLVDYLLVVEAKAQSGALITAKAALEFGKDIGAIPGPIDVAESEGTNQLIQSGAYCIVKPDEVVEHMRCLQQRKERVQAPRALKTGRRVPT